tara:strand:- start:2743 stop:3495 length:753 start_codon:yes stop_codon:yes gene_type:complete
MTWTPEQETILKAFAEKSACYRYLNYDSYIYYKAIDQRFSLPIIVLSTLAGSASLGSNNLPEWSNIITLASAVVNIITGIMGTLQRFLNTSELTAQHFTSSVEFGRLSRDITVMLTLPRDDRNVDGSKFLESSANEYNRLVDQSCAPPKWILTKFETKFKNNTICKPDLVALTPININSKQNPKSILANSISKEKQKNQIELEELRQSSIVSLGRKQSLKSVLENTNINETELSEIKVVKDNRRLLDNTE